MKITTARVVTLAALTAFSAPLARADEAATKTDAALATPKQQEAAAQPLHKEQPGYHHRFQNAKHWAKVFDDPARDVWQKPDQAIAALKLKKTDKIADIGAGTGYFAVRMAKLVPDGKVFAIDTEQDMVDYLGKLVKEKKVPNMIPVKCAPGDPKIPEKVDLAIIVDTLHHIDGRVKYLDALRKQFSPHGRLAIIDFTQESPHGPPVEHRLKKETVIDELKSAGYALKDEYKFLPNQYFLVFSRMDDEIPMN